MEYFDGGEICKFVDIDIITLVRSIFPMVYFGLYREDELGFL